MSKVNVELSSDQALVLFDWLARFNGNVAAVAPTTFEDPSEKRVLFDLEALLETVLVAPLSANDSSLLQAAREAVRDGGDPSSR